MGSNGNLIVEHAETASLAPPACAHDLFVVHAAADAGFVRRYLLPALNLPPARVLLVDALPLGGMVVAEIDRAVSRSRFTVAVLSPAYLADRWAVFGEQLASHLSAQDVHVIPLRLTRCDLPPHLAARVTLDFTDPACWDTEAARLRELLATVAPADEQIACPYPGMRAFGEDDAKQFFGRDREIEELIGRLDRGEHEIYVIGPSGSGKSSLVQAGLSHALHAGSSRLERSFLVRTMRPGQRPAEQLVKILEGDLATAATTIEALAARHLPAKHVLVFVDQLEELFTLASAVERHRFIAALRMLRSIPQCFLLLALRADFFGALLDSELGPDFAGRIVPLVVAPLRGAALAHAITGPAVRVGVHVEARLCDRLVADAADEPGVLPLVQETLRLLWDKRRQRLLGLAAYEELGDGARGLDVAIARRADTMMAALTTARQTIARRILLRLVSFGAHRADTRRPQELPSLRSAAEDDAEFSLVLQHLVAHRLVTVDGSEVDRDALADLSHEALITAWPALRAWLDQSRADEHRRRRLEAKVIEWIERGRGRASLLDVAELAEAVQWMHSDAARALGYGTALPALVAASRSEIERLERQQREAQEVKDVAQHRLAMRHLEQGRALLFDGLPMQALPYLVEARAAGMESPVLRMLFAQAQRGVPLASLIGHTADIRAAAFSPDGTRVVTASDDRTARVWDATTGEPLTVPLEHQAIVTSAVFSPDGTRVVTASEDKTARVWDTATGKPVTPPLEHEASVNVATFSPDGARVVTASDDKTACVWQVATGKPVTAPLEHQATVTAVAFSPDGTYVATASDHTARVWHAVVGAPVTAPLEHQATVAAVAFSPDGTYVVTASDDKAARVWSVSTGKLVTAPLQHQAIVTAAAFSPDGERVVTASWDRTARVWSVSTGKPVTAPLEHQAAVTAAAFSPDGTRVVTASLDRTARVWDAATSRPLSVPLRHQGFVTAAAFSPDGTRVVATSTDRTVRVWDVTKPNPVTAVLKHRANPHFDRRGGDTFAIRTMAFSPDLTRLITASRDRNLLWDATTQNPVAIPLEATVTAAAFSPDGTRVITASQDKTALVRDAATGDPVSALLRHQATVTAVAFSPDGMRVVTASQDDTARVWDAVTGEPVSGLLRHQATVTAAAFSPDGTRVVTASGDKTVRVWDVTTSNLVTAPLQHLGWVNAAAFSPDGNRVVTASQDNTVRMWNVATGELVAAPLEHLGWVNAAAFNPDGTRVLTASGDKTVRVWDVMTGKLVTLPLEHPGRTTAAAFSSDGTRIVTASANTAHVWDATTGKPVTAPFEHQSTVTAAAFSTDGTRVVTVSGDTVRVWTLSIHMGSLDDWRLLARWSPFALSIPT